MEIVEPVPNHSEILSNWPYDATTDNLNRATTLGGVAVTNDVLGNRLTKGGVTYGWDALNRLTGLSGNVTASYAYRADGMRVSKLAGGVATRYRHDGQMGMEDVETQGANTVVTRYGLGARGVDLIERTGGSTVTTGFPLYDAHGNNVATLSRASNGGYSVNDRRSYDAWGVVRAQQSGGDPKLRYCASIGHKQDDESGLIYMRARYYEPSSGRFVSADCGRQGFNWYTYCGNDPISRSDQSGNDWQDAIPNLSVKVGH